MKKLIVIPIFILVSIFAIAQDYGYLGKRASIFGKVNINPDMNFNTITPKLSLGADVDYVVSRLQSIGISIDFLRLKDKENAYHQVYPSYHDEINDTYITGSFWGTSIHSAKYIQAYIKTFRYSKKGAIAPVGKYFKFGMGAVLINGKFTPNGDDETIMSYSYNDFLLTTSWGNQRIFKDKYYITTEFTISIPVGSLFLNPNASDEYLNNFVDLGVDNLFAHKFLSYKVGFGTFIPKL